MKSCFDPIQEIAATNDIAANLLVAAPVTLQANSAGSVNRRTVIISGGPFMWRACRRGVTRIPATARAGELMGAVRYKMTAGLKTLILQCNRPV
ncbi:hypothetical protein FJY94_06150 [Candidatus Kaiserbacteria bacterium]|nr:hypothetical protein [Candidatus Kaiserbacteria bacterium]